MGRFSTVRDAVHEVYASYVRAKPYVVSGFDRDVRHPEWTRRLLDRLGSPDHKAYNIAVTGSKGKGSHSIFLACILERLGFRVGLFTSPHLVDFMERFRVNGQLIGESEFLNVAERVLDIVAEFEIPGTQYCGPVGILAAMAACWFAETGTQVNVFECGRGALHDDVNQIRHRGAIVAPIFLEHAHHLGPTLADIGREKAGVVTTDTTWVVSQVQSAEVGAEINDRVSQVGDASLEWVHPSDFTVEDRGAVAAIRMHGELRRPTTVLIPSEYIPLASNAATALRGAMMLVQNWTESTLHMPEVIDLTDIRMPGRLHVVREHPRTVVDGTIHASSARLVLQWLDRQQARGGKVGAILGLPTDKDGMGMLETLAPVVDWCILSKAHNPSLKFDGEWYTVARERGMNVFVADDIEQAARMADAWTSAEDTVLVLGTQSFVGDSLTYYGANSQSVWKSSHSEASNSPQSGGASLS